jgi:GT2 family glycosyltransferase
MRVGAILVTYAVYPEALFSSVQNTKHTINWYIHHHGDDQELELRLKHFAASGSVDLRLHRANRGLSKSWNDALESSLAAGNDFTLLLNDDLFFYEGAFDQFVSFLIENPGFGIAVAHGFEPRTGTVSQQGFACCALGEPALKSVGFFDENLSPAYFEDIDYWHRARLAGAATIDDRRTLVEHDRSSTIRAVSDEIRLGFLRAIEANKAYFIRKWGGVGAHIKFRHPFDDERFGLKIECADRSAPYGYPYDRIDGQFSENLAHIQNQGDTWFPPGQWCGKPGSGLWIEGLLLARSAGIEPRDLQYAAILERNVSSDWSSCGEYLGSRGSSAPLRGLRMRLTGSSAGTHELSCAGTFVDGSAVGPISGSEIVCATNGSHPLEAFRFELKQAPKQEAKAKKKAQGVSSAP